MNSLIIKISNSELEVLKLLWQAKRGMTITEIRNILTANTEWEASTIKTLVRRLCEKKVLKAEKREVFYYTTAVSEQEYNGYATQQMIDRLYGGSAKNLVASLIDGNKLTDSDINELRSLLKEGDPK